MRRWMICLLTLALLMLSVPAPAEEALSLPAPGEVIEGFEVIEVRPYPMLGAQLLHMRHVKTGAEAIYIANDDTDRFFALAFNTQAIDETGLPHVFEHATLNGSDRFPSSALFFNLSFQTYNTYMNAFTMDRMTMYPVASLSEAQLLKLADFYTDSCFHPMVLEDESIWREEAWRYRLESADAPLTLEGTVYSEMLGSTLESVAYKNWLKTAFPGSFIGYEQGGDPDYIPDMTWEDLKAYHERFYHPSNCSVYLYGKLDHYEDFLRLLDREFSRYEPREFSVDDAAYAPLTESREAEHAYPAEASADPGRKSAVFYSYILPEDAREDMTRLEFLSTLFSVEEGSLAQAIKTKLPYGELSVWVEAAAPAPALVFQLERVNPEDKEIFVEAVEAAIAEAKSEGFPKETMDSLAASTELSTLLIRENSSLGEAILQNVGYSYACSGNLLDYFDSTDAMLALLDAGDSAAFSELCATYLTEDAIRVTDVTYPEPGLKEQKDADKAARLAEVKAAMSEEELNALLPSGEDAKAEDAGTAAMVRELTAVTVESLPEEVPEYDVIDGTDENGVRWLEAPAGVENVCEVQLMLDADFLSAEELQYLKLGKDLIDYLNTEAHTQSEIARLRSRYLYEGSIGVLLLKQGEDAHPYLSFSWKARPDDLAAGYDLMKELYFDLKFDDPALLRDAVEALRTACRADVNQAPYNELLLRAIGRTDAQYRTSAFLGGVSNYEFLSGVLAQLDADPEAVIDALNAVRERVHSAANAVVVCAGDEAVFSLNEELAAEWLDDIGYDERERVERVLPVAEAREALVIDSSVQYNGLFANYGTLGLEGYDAALDAVTSVISDKFLFPMLREAYGVYTPLHEAIDPSGVYLLTYRDPNVTETFDVFAQLADLVAKLEITQEELNGYILSAYSGYAMPSGALSGAMSAAIDCLSDDGSQDVLESMRQLKQLTPEKLHSYADLYRALSEKGGLFTAGGAGAVESHADLYDQILNPFSVQDKSGDAFADLPADSEFGESVRFAYENGLMQPTSGDVFGVEEPAAMGEFAAALYSAMGGGSDPEEAVSALSQYGILPAGAAASDELTRGAAAESVGSLLTMSGESVDGEAPADLIDSEALTPSMRWSLEVGLLAPVETENGPAAAPERMMNRGELAQLLYLLLSE